MMKFDHYRSSKNSGEWVWNSRAKLCQITLRKWNDSRVSLQELDFMWYIVLEYSHWLCLNGVVASMLEFQSSSLGLLPRRGKYDLLLNVWYSESFVKEKQTPHFILVVWSALVVGGCFMVAWGRKSYLGPAETSSVVCTRLNSRMGETGWFVCIALGKTLSSKGASPQPAFMDSCLTCVYPHYIVDKLILICSVPIPLSHSGASGGSFDVFQGQDYVGLLPGHEMSAGFHYRNLILGI